MNEQVDRELAFMKLARHYPDAQLLYTGGSSGLTHQQFKGLMQAGNFLMSGVLIWVECVRRESRNTSESATLKTESVA